MFSLGCDDYRYAALARLDDAITLEERGRWVASIYLAGRAVESMLRSILWYKNRGIEVGHDLRDLLKKVRELGVLKQEDDVLYSAVNELAVVWHNNLRFTADERFERYLKETGRHLRVNDKRVFGDPKKVNALRILDVSEAIISRGELIWRRFRKNSTRS